MRAQLTEQEAASRVGPNLATVAGIMKLSHTRLASESHDRVKFADGRLPPTKGLYLCEDHHQWIRDECPAASEFSLRSTWRDAPLEILRNRALMPMCTSCVVDRIVELGLPAKQPIGHIDTCLCASSIIRSECAYCAVLAQAALKAEYILKHAIDVGGVTGLACACGSGDFACVTGPNLAPCTQEFLRLCAGCQGVVSVPLHAFDGKTHLAAPLMEPSFMVKGGLEPPGWLMGNNNVCDDHPVETFGDRTNKQYREATMHQGQKGVEQVPAYPTPAASEVAWSVNRARSTSSASSSLREEAIRRASIVSEQMGPQFKRRRLEDTSLHEQHTPAHFHDRYLLSKTAMDLPGDAAQQFAKSHAAHVRAPEAPMMPRQQWPAPDDSGFATPAPPMQMPADQDFQPIMSPNHIYPHSPQQQAQPLPYDLQSPYLRTDLPFSEPMPLPQFLPAPISSSAEDFAHVFAQELRRELDVHDTMTNFDLTAADGSDGNGNEGE